jgi:hypothetical protein
MVKFNNNNMKGGPYRDLSAKTDVKTTKSNKVKSMHISQGWYSKM